MSPGTLAHMAAEGTIRSRLRSLLRSNSIKLKKRARHPEQLASKVTLEKVLGITAAGNRALSCDPKTGLLAYPAGCVVVLLNPRKNKQQHIFNSSRKAITTLAFSPDGKYVVTGESGHMPAVRVWEVTERAQIAELQEHKYGVACVTFSPNGKYIVSVGYQHDMMVCVWNWKKNVVVAANKVSSKVCAVSFSADSSYFVTAGNRHVKFWYLDHNKTNKVNATVPLLGRSGLLGELRTNCFSDVACGRGKRSASTFCITSSGLLCEFNERRLLDKWVELRTSQATCLCVSEELIFCGCSDGTVRAFSPFNLEFLCTLPRPHALGTDVCAMTKASQLFSSSSESRFPDTLAVSFDPVNGWLSCVYSDHSVYVWDLQHVHERQPDVNARDPHVHERDPRRAGKLYSALYHSSCVWSLEIYPDSATPLLPPGTFLSCSSDSTIRIWILDPRGPSQNILSHDLQKILYVDENLALLLDVESSVAAGNGAGPETEQRAGLRTLKVRPDGVHLASGDRQGALRIHDLRSMKEILNVQAHDSEILCLEFSKPDTGLQLLASASRDRLIHVLDSGEDYSLVQTLDEHSSSITAVRFTANEGRMRMISCGADKSVYFRTAHKTEEGLQFSRTHHVVRKTTLYDMDIEPTKKYAAVGCQDRSIRIFNISNGKQKRMYRGSQGEDGTLIKVQIDPSGLYIATSCSDKNISIFDFCSGECVATMYGHSEIVTSLKFSSDCRHLLSASGDSCIFVWRLPPELTIRMRQRLSELRPQIYSSQNAPAFKDSGNVIGGLELSSDSDRDEDEEPNTLTESPPRTVSELKLNTPDDTEPCSQPRPVRKRWTRREPSDRVLMVHSMFDLRDLDSLQPELEDQVKPHPSKDNAASHSQSEPEPGLKRISQALGSTVSLQVDPRTNHRPDFILLANQSSERDLPVLYPDQWDDRVSLAGNEFQVQEAGGAQDKPSPDSGVSVGFSCRSSPERPSAEDLERLSADGNSSDLEEEEERPVAGRGRTTAGRDRTEHVPQTPDQEAFLKEHFGTLAEPKGSPSKASHSSSESLSISSRFLSHSSAHIRSSVPLASRSDGKTPLVSEVHPLRETLDQDLNQDQELNQDQKPGLDPGLDQRQTKDPHQEKPQTLPVSEVRPLMDQRLGLNPDQGLNQDQTKIPGLAPVEDAIVETTPLRAGLSKKKPVDCRKSQGSRAQSQNQNIDLRKAQSVTSLLPESADPAPPPSPSPVTSVTPVTMVRPSTLPSTPRRPLLDSCTLPRKHCRSYMSPTASSKAKVTRSASIGDGLNDLSPLTSLPVAQVATVTAVPVLVAPPLSASGRSLQSRIQNKPLPDKPILAVFTPSSPLTRTHPTTPDPLLPRTHSTSPNSDIKAPVWNIPPQSAESNHSCNLDTHTQPDPSLTVSAAASKGDSPDPRALPMAPPLSSDTASALRPDPQTHRPHLSSSDLMQQNSHETGEEGELSMEACEALTNELQSCFSRATHLYRKLSVASAESPAPERSHMISVLSECFQGLRVELEGLPLGLMGVEGGANAEGGRTAAILEEYSLLLVQAVTRRLQSPTHPVPPNI
ncbi:mitogen-activated protein kinase-binding protein 1 isoform X2 [Periophthalmus magnuspinnatus]|uniref:mitogen-activated protein kinase-binding protein 1 isoform X2 n=1 Tax=Periophthalmus magnuspinnatus TaxID=409849 RepID=UPI002436D8ED|nr:mitogen-activated protein kinase-binding protein 1 isoform X2 [Periophthalmus magnuspinnatus]